MNFHFRALSCSSFSIYFRNLFSFDLVWYVCVCSLFYFNQINVLLYFFSVFAIQIFSSFEVYSVYCTYTQNDD